MAVWNLLLSSILVPLVAITLLGRKSRVPITSWLVTFFMAAGLTGFSFLVAPWGWFGVPVRWTIAVLFVAATAVSLTRRPGPHPQMTQMDADEDVHPRSSATSADTPIRIVVKLLIGFFFGSVALGVVRGHQIPPGAVDLGFPLREGRFLVLHGGSTPASNIHHPDPRQRYAVDFVKLGRFGMHARGIAPDDPARHHVFGAQVVAPCDGAVVRAVDGQPDGGPATTTPGPQPDPLGNQIVLRCGDVDVTLAHLQLGSVTARQGARVARGAPLARAGHSGASPEPHLHIHAERNGAAVPLTLEGEWMVRNDAAKR